jgi:hypothetical protein
MTSDADEVNFSAQSGLATAFFDYMALLAVPVLVSQIRNSVNSGMAQRVDQAKHDLEQAERTMRYMICTQSFGDGSEKTIIGLQGILPTSGVGSNTVYGLPESSNAFWKNTYETSAGSFATNGHHGSSDDKLWRKYRICSDNGALTPNLVISDGAVFDYYVRAEGQYKRITKDSDFGKIGMSAGSDEAGRGIPYFNAEWVWDNECPAGHTYLIHTDDFELIEDPNLNFRWMGPISLGKQIMLSGRVLVYRVQSKVGRRNWNGVISGWTA